MTIAPKNYRKRLVDDKIEVYLKVFGAISVEGPKWCGKTWTARNHCNSEIELDPPTLRMLQTDSSLAFEGDEPRLIDEWQIIPDLWDQTRFEVDRSNRKGRFILCGSSTIKQSDKIHTGAGRIGSIKMQTMSLFESGDSDGAVSLQNLFENKAISTAISKISLKKLIELATRGGWPELVGENTNPKIAINDYIDKLCNEDVSAIDGRNRNPRKIKMLLKSIARNESTVVSDETLRKDISENNEESIAKSTLEDYKAVLERLHIIWYQSAYSTNVRSSVRIGKSPKKHLVDPSLAMVLLNLTEERALLDLETFGFVFESLCERDLKIYSEYHGYSLFHYRDSKGKEIDAIVEREDGEWGAFEIKLGFGQVEKAAEHLIKIAENFDKKPKFMCVICGMAPAAYKRPDGVYVIPITRLGP